MAPMNLNEALTLLQVTADTPEEERLAIYAEQQEALSDKITKAPTPGLKAKYEEGLKTLQDAIEVVESSLIGNDLPMLQPIKEGHDEAGVPKPETQGSRVSEPSLSRSRAGRLSRGKKSVKFEGPSRRQLKQNNKLSATVQTQHQLPVRAIVVSAVCILITAVCAYVWWDSQQSELDQLEKEWLGRIAETDDGMAAFVSRLSGVRKDRVERAWRGTLLERSNTIDLAIKTMDNLLRNISDESREVKYSLNDRSLGVFDKQFYEVKRDKLSLYNNWMNEHVVSHPARLHLATAKDLVRTDLAGMSHQLNQAETALLDWQKEHDAQYVSLYAMPFYTWLRDKIDAGVTGAEAQVKKEPDLVKAVLKHYLSKFEDPRSLEGLSTTKLTNDHQYLSDYIKYFGYDDVARKWDEGYKVAMALAGSEEYLLEIGAQFITSDNVAYKNEGLVFLRRASENGSMEAALHLAKYYAQTPGSNDESLQFYAAAIALGHDGSDALFVVGKHYIENSGSDDKPSIGERYVVKAARAYNENAIQYCANNKLFHKKGAHEGDASSQLYHALEFWDASYGNDKEREIGLMWLEKSVTQNNSEALLLYGLLHETGANKWWSLNSQKAAELKADYSDYYRIWENKLLERNDEKALKYYNQASASGCTNPLLFCQLSMLLMGGDVKDQQQAEAVLLRGLDIAKGKGVEFLRWYTEEYGLFFKAGAERGVAEDQFKLGKLYLESENASVRNGSKGLQYLNQAAAQHHEGALYVLATLYKNGNVTEPDITKSIDYLERVLEVNRKHKDAPYLLGVHYWELGSVAQREKARNYLSQAFSNGNELAYDFMIKNKVIASPSQLTFNNPACRTLGKLGLVSLRGGSTHSESAVAEALNWFVRHQSPNGMWDIDGYPNNCSEMVKCEPGTSHITENGDGDCACTALAILCFLGAGYDHKVPNKHKSVVEKGVNWLVKQMNEDGSFGASKRNYESAMCALALCEAYWMTKDSNLKDAAQKSINGLIARQAKTDTFPKGLGWNYTSANPSRNDFSVSGWCAMALYAAELGGLDTGSSIDGARGCLLAAWKSVNPNHDSLDFNQKSQFVYTYDARKGEARGSKEKAFLGALPALLLGVNKNDKVITTH